jgi:S1-C subfamily serine protease
VLEDVSVASYDALTDIALLELREAQPFPFKISEMFGDSTSLKQGFSVYCLAHHNKLSSTLTRGIVSAVSRKAPEVGNWIQIDANVTPGASGGLLIGEDLKVYGMVVAGLLFEDINFAVPSQSIFEVLDRLKAGQPLKRPWLGLLLEQPRHKTWDPKIIEVFPSSPLSQLKVDENAILMEINHQRILTITQAQEMINSLEAGNIVHIKIENRIPLSSFRIQGRCQETAYRINHI